MTSSIRQVAPIRKGVPRGLAKSAPQDLPQVPAGVGHHSSIDTASQDVMGAPEEEDSKVEPLPSTNQAKSMNAWVHFNASILNNCRTMHLDPPEDDG